MRGPGVACPQGFGGHQLRPSFFGLRAYWPRGRAAAMQNDHEGERAGTGGLTHVASDFHAARALEISNLALNAVGQRFPRLLRGPCCSAARSDNAGCQQEGHPNMGVVTHRAVLLERTPVRSTD